LLNRPILHDVNSIREKNQISKYDNRCETMDDLAINVV
jgi:hypothetical protein